MSELRKDPLVDRWVIIAENRAARPISLAASATLADAGDCDFCEGRESATPGELLAYRPSGLPVDGPGWRVRVIPNKYPAVSSQSAPAASGPDSPLFCQAPGLGAHEVIVESPRHLTSGAEQTKDELVEVFRAYRERMLAHRNAGDVRHVSIFKNVGAAAGASLPHAHSQLLGLPSVPRNIADEIAGAQRYFAARGACAFCELIAAERAAGTRVALDQGDYLLICPWASRLSFEMWILPTRHQSHFECDRRNSLDSLAEILNRALRRLELSLGLASYNYWLHSAPFDSRDLDHYHWHIEILPRTTQIAGLEWGAGVYINPVSPEQAASRLRSAAE